MGCMARASTIQYGLYGYSLYGYREWGFHGRVFPKTFANGKSKNEIRRRNKTKDEDRSEYIDRMKTGVNI